MTTYSHMLYLIYSIKFSDFSIQVANTTKMATSYKVAEYLKCRRPKFSRQQHIFINLTILFDVSSFDTKITFKLSSPDFVSRNDSRLLLPTTINTFLAFISVYREGAPRVGSAPAREFLASSPRCSKDRAAKNPSCKRDLGLV
jgi:hypothetical protein